MYLVETTSNEAAESYSHLVNHYEPFTVDTKELLHSLKELTNDQHESLLKMHSMLQITPFYNQMAFGEVYKNKVWGNAGGGSGAGSGYESTRNIVAFLPQFFNDNAVTSFLDLGCGAFTWQVEIFGNPENRHIQYTGADVVPGVISNLTATFEAENAPKRLENVKFVVADVSIPYGGKSGDQAVWEGYSPAGGASLPTGVDVVLLRDIVQHLVMRDIFNIFRNIREHIKPRFLLVTTYPATQKNYDLDDVPGASSSLFGSYRTKKAGAPNLLLPPFNIEEGELIGSLQDKPSAKGHNSGTEILIVGQK